MNVKMMAGLLVVALAGGCAHVTLLPDEHLWAEGHKISVPQLPPVPPDAAAVEGAPEVAVEARIIAVTAGLDRQLGVGKLVGKRLSLDEFQALTRAAEVSNSAIIISSSHMSAKSGMTQEIHLTTHGSYVSDYALTNNIWVPVLSEYAPDVVSFRLKASPDSDTVVLENVAALASSCFLVQCTATFQIPAVPEVCKVTLTWYEPVQEKHTAVLKESVRLKLNEGMVFELPGIIERGVSNLRVPLKSSDIREKGYPGAGGTKERMIYYAIIAPAAITPAEPKTAMVAH
jgi:hypothetical protein